MEDTPSTRRKKLERTQAIDARATLLPKQQNEPGNVQALALRLWSMIRPDAAVFVGLKVPTPRPSFEEQQNLNHLRAAMLDMFFTSYPQYFADEAFRELMNALGQEIDRVSFNDVAFLRNVQLACAEAAFCALLADHAPSSFNDDAKGVRQAFERFRPQLLQTTQAICDSYKLCCSKSITGEFIAFRDAAHRELLAGLVRLQPTEPH